MKAPSPALHRSLPTIRPLEPREPRVLNCLRVQSTKHKEGCLLPTQAATSHAARKNIQRLPALFFGPPWRCCDDYTAFKQLRHKDDYKSTTAHTHKTMQPIYHTRKIPRNTLATEQVANATSVGREVASTPMSERPRRG